MIRDIRRKIAGNEGLQERFADLLALAHRVRFQDHRQRGHKVYALHTPDIECIGKGKTRAPYEFGCKASIATPATKPNGGQFVLHAEALHGNPFDGHTLGPVIADLEKLTGVETRASTGQGLPRPQSQGEVHRRPGSIRREMERRAAVGPVIGHTKAEHRMGRNYLKGRDGDSSNAVLAAAGYYFSRLLRWLERLLRALIQALIPAPLAAQIG